jgi:hypothetical protein
MLISRVLLLDMALERWGMSKIHAMLIVVHVILQVLREDPLEAFWDPAMLNTHACRQGLP